MLVIKPIEDKMKQKDMVTQCGGTYRENALAYAAYDCEDDGETIRFPIGVCQFSLAGTKGIIDTLRSCPDVSDEEAMMIMARACTSFLHRCGFPEAAILPGGANDGLAAKLGFTVAEDGSAWLDVNKYYTGPCRGEQLVNN